MSHPKLFTGIYRMPGSRFLWYRWSENGKRYAISLATEDEGQALQKKNAIRADIDRRGSDQYTKKKNGESAAANPFERIVREYLAAGMSRDRKAMTPHTAKNLGYILNQFARESGINSLRDLQPDSMSSWLRSKRKIRSTETLRSHTRDLKAFRRYLIDQNLVRDLVELSMPDAPPVGRKNWLEQTVVDTLIAAVKPEYPAKAKPETIAKAEQNCRRSALYPELRVQCRFTAQRN